MLEFSHFILSTIHFVRVINTIRHEKSQTKGWEGLTIFKERWGYKPSDFFTDYQTHQRI